MDIYLKELQSALDATISRFHEELQSVRSNRPSVQLVEDIKVECYGQVMRIKEVASISIRPPRDIEISVWDKSIIPLVAKAIENAKAGLSVGNSDTFIRVSLPALTDERRAEIAKLAKRMSEDARIQVRHHRDEVMKKLKSAQDEGVVSEDQIFKMKESAQKIVDGGNKKIEDLLNAKLEELAE